ncbi:MAG: 1-acyl-sn-glycerol-3-phosphate acyltransferase [Vibrionaceae bacterium]
MQQTTDPFFDIRPYHDDEVPQAIARLINDKEFTHAIIKYRFAIQNSAFSWLLTPLLKQYLRSKWGKIVTVADVQQHIASYMQTMLKNCSDGFSCSGIEKLQKDQSYLFISNHRDISMDPALVNWSLFQNGFDTVRIAIGDNLLKKPCATELMKLNKSFIVKRSAKAPREMMNAFSQLSKYIKASLDEKQSIWIAQKEGRAKDGDDKTDPALLKMFFMNGKQEKQQFSEYMAGLRIVPVTISYENDPCDVAKANELYQLQTTGSYQKQEFEDISSIVQGITGKKRRVHVAFGEQIEDGFSTPEELAALIDQQIYANYRLFPINYLAAEVDDPSVTEQEKQLFTQKMSSIAPEIAPFVKKMYAMPVSKKPAL